MKNATVVPPTPGVGRKGMDTSLFLGYTPIDRADEGLSWSLDGYLNDFGIAQMAQALDQEDRRGTRYQEEAEYFLDRARTT